MPVTVRYLIIPTFFPPPPPPPPPPPHTTVTLHDNPLPRLFAHVARGSPLPNQHRRYAKMEAQSEHVHVAFTFLHVWAPICKLSRRLFAKFPHRSSLGSLLRVHCWLGDETYWKKVFVASFFFLPFMSHSVIHAAEEGKLMQIQLRSLSDPAHSPLSLKR